MAREIRSVCVYCASSRQADPAYASEARRLGTILAERGIGVVYGGGAVGSMGALADGALGAGGTVTGILPTFMDDLEWGHRSLSELRLVNDMHERKRTMIREVDGLVALPGGCGTFEELLEAITWKRLGLYLGPIVIVNQNDYYEPLLAMLERAVAEHFMDQRHLDMWSSVPSIDEVLPALESAPEWDAGMREFSVP